MAALEGMPLIAIIPPVVREWHATATARQGLAYLDPAVVPGPPHCDGLRSPRRCDQGESMQHHRCRFWPGQKAPRCGLSGFRLMCSLSSRAQTSEWAGPDRVFVGRDGQLMRNDAIRQAFTRARKKVNMPRFRFHDAANGVSPSPRRRAQPRRISCGGSVALRQSRRTATCTSLMAATIR